MRTVLVGMLLALLFSTFGSPLLQVGGHMTPLSTVSTSHAIAGDTWPGGD